MKNGFWLTLISGFIIAILIMPSAPVKAYGQGGTNGTVGGTDTYWIGNWSTVYVHSDTTTDPWTTGLTFENISYEDVGNGDNAFNLYVREVTIPWIAIKWIGDNNYYIYPHDNSGGNMNCKLLFNGPWQGGVFNGYTEIVINQIRHQY